jgi:hypothetical protein
MLSTLVYVRAQHYLAPVRLAKKPIVITPCGLSSVAFPARLTPALLLARCENYRDLFGYTHYVRAVYVINPEPFRERFDGCTYSIADAMGTPCELCYDPYSTGSG